MTVKKALEWFDRERLKGQKATGKKFFDLKKFVEDMINNKALYGMVYGERSNAKTYGLLFYGIVLFVVFGRPFAIVRRYDTDLVRSRAVKLFTNLSARGCIEFLTEGMWDRVWYYGSMWYFAREDEDGKITHANVPFAYGYAINMQEHDKSSGDLNFSMIFMDEFIAKHYLIDEFATFMNVISSLIRNADDVMIFMAGNSINPYGNPYFREMGLSRAKSMQPGQMDLYHYGESELRVLILRTEPSGDEAKNSVYFAFDNPKLEMITRGEWDIEVYPHIPHKLRGVDSLFSFFVLFDDQTLQCDIVVVDNCQYLAVHPKSGEIKEPDSDLVYSLRPDPRPNWRKNWRFVRFKIEEVIARLFSDEKVFYSDNMVGEVMRNYLESAGC